MDEVIDRRRLLATGGLSVVTATVLAACGGGGGDGGGEEAEEPKEEEEKASAQDLVLLRTASSLEVLAVQVYTQAAKAGVLKNKEIADAATLFRGHHNDHADLLQSLTKKYGGDAFEQPNPVVAQTLGPRIQAIRNDNDLVLLAIDLERAAAATYQAAVGQFQLTGLNQTAMSIGGAEARHVSILSSFVARPTFGGAFATTEAAVAPGTGV